MLNVKNLTVRFPTRFGDFVAIEDVSISVAAGEIHGLVGESGAGKSTLGAAVISLLQTPGYVSAGTIMLGDTDLRALNVHEAHAMRGKRISMIFQDPQTSLNPLMTVEDQLIETIMAHRKVSVREARNSAIELLEEIGIKEASVRIKAWPHQFSGGMRQRVVIALALCTNPELIIADEPTTALDVAVQSQVLDLLRTLADKRKIGFILITHDIGVIARIADRVSVMRSGKVVESGETAQVLGNPHHPYTRALMDAVPPLDHKIDRFKVPLLEGAEKEGSSNADFAEQWLLEGEQRTQKVGLSIENLNVNFAGTRTSLWQKPSVFKALKNINIEVLPGSVLGLVGESGSGKSTLAKVITGLIVPESGQMYLGEKNLPVGSKRSRHHPSRRLIQMVFQDPYSSLNSRHRISTILSEPLWFYGLEKSPNKRRELVLSMLELVGMPSDAIDKYPHQFSGGQRQRIAVARALLARPRFLICDEPTSALDVSIQAEILNLLKDLQSKFGLSILFISHNLSVVRQMADDMVVLRNGVIEESGKTQDLFDAPSAQYTQKLLALTPMMPKAWRS